MYSSTVSSLTNPNANLILDRVIDAIRTLLDGLEKSKLTQSQSQLQLHPQSLPDSSTVASSSTANQQDKSVGVVDDNQSQPQTQTQTQTQPLPDSNTTAISSNGNQQDKSVGVAEDDDYQSLGNQIVKLSRDLVYIRNAFMSLKNFEESALNLLENLDHYRLDELLFEDSAHHPNDVASRNKRIQGKLRVLGEIVMRLKLKIPSPHKISSISSETGRRLRMASENNAHQLIGKLSELHLSQTFKDSHYFC